MKSKFTKLGAALAIAFAVATPVLAAAPADAAMIKVVDVVHTNGPSAKLVRYEHRSEQTYRDMYWQRQVRFHRHDMGWLRHHHFERFYVR